MPSAVPDLSAVAAKPLPIAAETLCDLADRFPTPFHVYDERGIRANARRLGAAFAWNPGFREYFAVKATPTPAILRLFEEEGCGLDCSSLAELMLAERVGVRGERIMFTSNNTPADEFRAAKELGAVLNLDDLSHLGFVQDEVGLPDALCFRYNPGPLRGGNAIIGKPEEAKYGFTRAQLFEGYRRAREAGVSRFGLHAMVASNELDPRFFVETARMLFALAAEVRAETGVRIEFVNLGGGIGIPYRPGEAAVNYQLVGDGVRAAYAEIVEPADLDPLAVLMENGRCMTGPYGVLVTRATHRKDIYKRYVGVDACMANLMRPGMYGAYHHVTVLGTRGEKADAPAAGPVDVVGSLCENNDKFAIDRPLPAVERGDVLAIHDAGAHGHSMGFQYNGKLRSAEYLLREDGAVEEIRRAETYADLFATLPR